MSANIRSFLGPFLAGFLLINSSTFAADSLEGGIGELARQIVDKSKSESKQSIAVAPFRHGDGSLSVLSNYMVDELVLRLFSIPDADLRIVERSQLEQMLQELELNQSGIVDVESAKQLGKVHGVDALIVGSITAIGETVRVIARMISTETGQVFSAAATTVPKTSTILSLSEQKISLQRTASGSNGSVISSSASHATRVGPLQIALQRIMVLPDSEIRVLLSVGNSSDEVVKIQEKWPSPQLHDGYGNKFKFSGGPLQHGFAINPGKTADVVIYFLTIPGQKTVGDTFGLTVPLEINDKKEYSFSFRNIRSETVK